VRKLVEMHGGRVQAHSDGANQGSTFSIRLPLMFGSTDTPAEGASGAAPLQPGEDNGIGVLVVDDNVDSAQSMAQLLAILGFRTWTAHDGQEALQVAGDRWPDAIVLDLGLPKLSGLDVARRVRAQPGWGGRVLLIALSGWGQDEDREKTREAGFDHHFVKPVDVEDMVQALGRVTR
jgi:CheY-like chemotaxis protein